LVDTPLKSIRKLNVRTHGTVSNLEQKFTVDLMKVMLPDDTDTVSQLHVSLNGCCM